MEKQPIHIMSICHWGKGDRENMWRVVIMLYQVSKVPDIQIDNHNMLSYELGLRSWEKKLNYARQWISLTGVENPCIKPKYLHGSLLMMKLRMYSCIGTQWGKLHTIIEALRCGVGNIFLMSYNQSYPDKWFCNRHTKANGHRQD